MCMLIILLLSCLPSFASQFGLLGTTQNMLKLKLAGPSWWHIAAHSEPGGTGRLILEDDTGQPQVSRISYGGFHK